MSGTERVLADVAKTVAGLPVREDAPTAALIAIHEFNVSAIETAWNNDDVLRVSLLAVAARCVAAIAALDAPAAKETK